MKSSKTGWLWRDGHSAMRSGGRRPGRFALLFWLGLGMIWGAAGMVRAQHDQSRGGRDDLARANWRRFVVPAIASDRTVGTAVDLSHLNEPRAGSGGFLRADGEKIVDAAGREVRLFGTNICDWQVMPDPDVAEPMARRLAELGVNFVRLHYFDYTVAPDGIFTGDMRTIDAEQLDRFDRLAHALIDHGIYIDINLHTARMYPSLPNWWEFRGKGIDRVHPGLIEQQQSFARQLLTHVNPYTGMSYVEDPGVAAVEISNENSAMLPWTSLNRSLYSKLPDEFRLPVQKLWNQWLIDRYGDLVTLKKAWKDDSAVDQTERVRNSNFESGSKYWNQEVANAGEATFKVVSEDEKIDGQSSPFVRWHITQPGGEDWSHQVNQSSLPVDDEKSYVIRIRARAFDPGDPGDPGDPDDAGVTPLKVSVMQQQEPWETVLGPIYVDLTNDWQTFEVAGSVVNPAGVPVRLNLDANNRAATFDIASVSVVEGSLDPLAGGVDLTDGDVPLPGGRTTAAMLADYDQFIIDRDIEFARVMRRFLRDDLGVKCLIWDSQANYDGTMGLLRESKHADVIDMHEYPDHPRGQKNAEGNFVWHVQHHSLLRGGFGKFETLNHYRVKDKPFFVSEFDLSPPGDHAHEALSIVPILASLQGWSGLAEYAWMNFQRDVDPDHIVGAFNTSGHAGQMAMFPTAALLYRTGMIRPLQSRQTLRVAADTLRHGPPGFTAMDSLWQSAGSRPEDAWKRRMTVDIVNGETDTELIVSDLSTSDLSTSREQQTIELDSSDGGPPFDCLTVAAPRLRCVVGQCGGGTYPLGDVTISVDVGTMRNYAGVYLVSLDNRPIKESRQMLLTTMARVENADWTWNDDRTTIGAEFGNGPTVAEPVSVTMKFSGEPVTRFMRLSGDGQPDGSPIPIGDDGRLSTKNNSGVWFLVER